MGAFFIGEEGIEYRGSIVAELVKPGSGSWKDHFCRIGENLWEWSRTISLEDAGECMEDFQMGIRFCRPVDFYMIPCVNYGGNLWGEGKEPKGLYCDGKPWIFAGHRSGIPAGMYGQNEEFAAGIFGAENNPAGVSAELAEKEDRFCMTLHFPEQEGPKIYCARDLYEERVYRETFLTKDKRLTFRAYLVLTERKNTYDYGVLLDTAWRVFDGKKETCGEKGSKELQAEVRTQAEELFQNRETVWRLGIGFVKNSIFFRQPGFSGFCMGLTWNGEQWEQKRDYLEIGWVGQNASLAVTLLYEYALNKDEEALTMGLEVLDCWADKGSLPGGLFRCRFDRILKFGENTDNREERNDAANLYSVVTEYLEAYHLLKALGIERENYRNLALGICSFASRWQREQGSLAKAWYNDGTCSDREGTVGCYLAEALCRGWQETRQDDMLRAAREAFDGYYEEFIRCGYTTAGALDTCCVDKESASPLLRTALELYQITGEGQYLDKALQISYYLATWQYHYNVSYEKSTLLGQMGYETRGGTAVSVQHHHIDCYGLEICEAWKKLAELTGKEIWRERSEALWKNSLQNISDGNLVIKGQRRPLGSQDEGFLQTRWHTKKGDYFGVSEWLVTWNTAFRLKILRKEFWARKREKDKGKDRI